MSLLAATQIPKPADEQAFERCSIVLWRGLLKDPNVQRNGRRGQRQNGVDLFGLRGGDAAHHVGIQCKLKGDGQVLTDGEVRNEVVKALTFKPRLKEYFIITTAPDDVALQELARELTAELHRAGTPLLIYVWGWNTLEEKIFEDDAARNVFDPTYGPYAERILSETRMIAVEQSATRIDIGLGFADLKAQMAEVAARLPLSPGDTTLVSSAVEQYLDAEIDGYREIANGGRSQTALGLLEKLLERLQGTASGRILFRIKANIGSCLLGLGDDQKAATLLAEAYEHAPDEPKAIANKALSLLLRGEWQEVLTFGAAALTVDPTNEGLAGYMVQAARFDLSIDDPLEIVPEGLRRSAPVAIGRVDFVRRRCPNNEWRAAARVLASEFPADEIALQFAAEADIDEAISSEHFHRTRSLAPGDRARVETAVTALEKLWHKVRVREGALRVEDAALCGNIVLALHALDELPKAAEVARQGLALAPDDIAIMTRAAMVASDSDDDQVQELVERLPEGPEATVLRFRLYSSQHRWADLYKLYETQARHIPDVERVVITTAARLAGVKLGVGGDGELEVQAIAEYARADARANVVVADFARTERLEKIAETAFQQALKAVGRDSHIAPRMMVAQHAGRRGDWSVVADLLDGFIDEERDSEPLRALARALVNDSPIRERALRFFARLPQAVRELPFYLHAEGLLHFNHGDLVTAEKVLRKAIVAQPELDNYLALFSVLRRSERSAEIQEMLKDIDLATVRGSTMQKMHLAQLLRSVGDAPKALEFAYGVLESAKNDPDAALGYFGLIMMNPDDGLLPRADFVGRDTWVRLEGPHGEIHAFLILDGNDRPADGILSPTHPTAVAAKGLKVGEHFAMPAAFGEERQWHVVEIKHKYLHALHDVMENFEKRFPDAKGFYTVTLGEGDIQPALEQVRRVSESNRRLADLYLEQHLPFNMVAAHMCGDTIGFVEYVRSLDFDLRSCIGTEAERVDAAALISQHRAAGAVLDTYAAWTVATMDAFDVLKAVFGPLVVAQSVIDELRILRDKHEITGQPSMTIAWQNGEYIKQEHSAEDLQSRRKFISEQIDKIETHCEVKPATAPDTPSDLASLITRTFDAHVLDAAHVAREGYLIISEDLYFRQLAEAAASTKGVWLQIVFLVAREEGQIDQERYVDAITKLAWRRHAHISIDAERLYAAFEADHSDELSTFAALARYIGTKDADMRSHLNVALAFRDKIWEDRDRFSVRPLKATSIILDSLIRHRGAHWALTLAFVKHDGLSEFRDYLDAWVAGHFLPAEEFSAAEREILALAHRVARARGAQVPKVPPPKRGKTRVGRGRKRRRRS
jgi:tetratricopeptide (TPR) repeat protein